MRGILCLYHLMIIQQVFNGFSLFWQLSLNLSLKTNL